MVDHEKGRKSISIIIISVWGASSTKVQAERAETMSNPNARHISETALKFCGNINHKHIFICTPYNTHTVIYQHERSWRNVTYLSRSPSVYKNIAVLRSKFWPHRPTNFNFSNFSPLRLRANTLQQNSNFRASQSCQTSWNKFKQVETTQDSARI